MSTLLSILNPLSVCDFTCASTSHLQTLETKKRVTDQSPMSHGGVISFFLSFQNGLLYQGRDFFFQHVFLFLSHLGYLMVKLISSPQGSEKKKLFETIAFLRAYVKNFFKEPCFAIHMEFCLKKCQETMAMPP